jgi:hypothetical protein
VRRHLNWWLLGPWSAQRLKSVATRTANLFLNRMYHWDVSKIYSAPADRVVAVDPLVRGVPEDEDDEEDEEKRGEDEEEGEDDDGGEGYSE